MLLHKKNIFETVVDEFNQRNPDVKVLSSKMDWYVSFAYIKKHNFEIAQEIDKLNVQNIMLKNAGFGLFLFAVIFAFEFLVNKLGFAYGVASVICFILTIIMMRESRKYTKWFFGAICQTLVALVISSEQLVDTFPPKIKPSRRSKKNG